MKFLSIENRPLYNSRIIDTYIKLIRSKYSYINVSDLLSYAGMEPYQVEDPGYWFTQKQVNLFYEKLKKLTGKKDIAREAGRYAASPDALGVMRQYILGLVGPAKAYEIIGKYVSNFTRSAVYESKRLGSNRFEITVIPNKGVKEREFQCENRMGYFEAIASIFNCKLPEIEETECLFKGGKVCRYTISWKGSVSDVWKNIRNYTALFLLPASIGFSLFYPRLALESILPISVSIIFVLSWITGLIEKKELNTAIDNLRATSDRFLEQINENYNNLLMINEIGQVLSKQIDINSILKRVVGILERRLDYDRGVIFLASPDKKRLIFRAGFGYSNEQLRILRKTRFHLDRPKSRGVFVVSFRRHKPFLINDINHIEGNLSSRSLDFAKKMGTKSFICCPITYEDGSLGVLVVDNIKTKRPLLQRDVNLLMGVASEIGISIHNAMLIETKERQFKSILQVLAASIDARDPLTAGHSEKVTEYAVGICKELGLPKDTCEMVRTASLLHDYGKIGVEDSILKKEGRLEEDEYEQIKTHAEKTRKILEQISFEGIYSRVPEIAEAHHERVDGRGYPRGLKGDEIPLEAKIITVADFFEAITSKRHYRDPMPIEVAFKLLEEKIGTYFEKRVVEALINYYCRKYGKESLRMVVS